MTKRSIRVSASRLKTLKTCSLYFWYDEVLRIPTNSHFKTRQGSCLHMIMQHLLHPKRRVALQAMFEGGFKLADWPSVRRFILIYDYHHKISPYTMEDMESMVQVALLGIKTHFYVDGQWSPPPRILIEHRFKMKIGEAEISGVLDLLFLWPDRAVCSDYKSQGTKFTKADVPHLIQARLYQMACYREFGLIPPVEFILVRHAPTARTSDKHMQITPPASPEALLGLEVYVTTMHERLNQFTLADAYANTCSDEGFCTRVCQYLRPFPYWIVCAATDPDGDNPKSSHLSLDSATQSKENGDIILERRHDGCPVRRTQSI